MEYKVIHTRETDNYTRYLKELSEKGFRVISAGMTANPAIKCFDWWAILEETPEEITVKLPEEPKDEAAGLLEAARKIGKTCKACKACADCMFADDMDNCRLSGVRPERWPIAWED